MKFFFPRISVVELGAVSDRRAGLLRRPHKKCGTARNIRDRQLVITYVQVSWRALATGHYCRSEWRISRSYSSNGSISALVRRSMSAMCLSVNEHQRSERHRITSATTAYTARLGFNSTPCPRKTSKSRQMDRPSWGPRLRSYDETRLSLGLNILVLLQHYARCSAKVNECSW